VSSESKHSQQTYYMYMYVHMCGSLFLQIFFTNKGIVFHTGKCIFTL